MAWMEELQHHGRERLDDLAVGSEGDLQTNAEEAYLVHVAEHCLAHAVEAQPV
jgi:hypothetical protein